MKFTEEEIKRIVEERVGGKSFEDIRQLLESSYGNKASITAIKNAFNNSFSSAGIPTESGTILSPVNSTDLIQEVAKKRAEKIEEVVGHLDELTENIGSYKKKMIVWLERLEEDLEEVYTEYKAGTSKLSLKQINEIKDSIIKTKQMLAAEVGDYSKILENYIRIVELAKPDAQKMQVDKLEVSFMVNQNINGLEKLGYIMVNTKTPEAKDALKALEEAGDIEVFKNA